MGIKLFDSSFVLLPNLNIEIPGSEVHVLLLVNFACWVIFQAFCCRLLLFSKLTFLKNSFRNTIRVPNSLDPDQDRCYVGPDLGPNCLQPLSADDNSHL